VYRFTVYLSSKIKLNHHRGDANTVIAQTPAAALSIMQQYYGPDLQNLQGPVLAEQGVITSMTGSFSVDKGAPIVDSSGLAMTPPAQPAPSTPAPPSGHQSTKP
jgi:hypothetical protein